MPQNLIDTTMNGVRSLGDVGRQFFVSGNPDEGTNCVSEIAVLGMVGAASERHRPLTLAAMEEFRELSFVLLRAGKGSIDFAVRQLRESVTQVTQAFLELPDTPLASTHSTYLSPYFSSTSTTSLRSLLTALVNALAKSQDVEAAYRISDHLSTWSDGIYDAKKKILILSVEKKSHFAFDVIHWITGVTDILIFASRAPHTPDVTRKRLEKNASWLFGTLTWIPTDKESASFVENLSFRTEVFEIALKALRDDWPDGFDAAWKLSMNWAIAAGRHRTGWQTLERWLSALCALALRGEINRAKQLKTELANRLQAADAPEQELRNQAARALREQAAQIREREYELDLIKRILASNDRRNTRKLLRDVAYILSPETAHEPIQPVWF